MPNERYNLNNISEISKNIEDIYWKFKSYQKKYNVQFEKNVHIIVGMFGSNAFCQREIIPEGTFCVEKLSPNAEHLKVIIADEFEPCPSPNIFLPGEDGLVLCPMVSSIPMLP